MVKEKRQELLIQSKEAQKKLSDKEKYVREVVTNYCNHEFIVYSKENNKHKEIIECVHCGLTNKYTLYENYLNQKLFESEFEGDRYESFETKLFNNTIKDETKLNFLSKEELTNNHISLLYQLAIILADDPKDNEQVFNIMKLLDSLDDELELTADIDRTKKILKKYERRQKRKAK